MNDDLEHRLRRGLHDLVSDSEPAPDLAAVVRGRAARRTRHRQILAAAAAVSVVVIGAGGWLVAGGHSSAAGGSTAGRAGPPVTSTGTATAAVPTLDASRIAYQEGSPTARDRERAARALSVLGSGFVLDGVSHLSPKDVRKPYQATTVRCTHGTSEVGLRWYEPSVDPVGGSSQGLTTVVTLDGADGTRTTMAAKGTLRLVITESPEPAGGGFPLNTRNETVARTLLGFIP